MANIAAQSLYEQKQREFATAGSGNERFEDDFVDSVNLATSEINIRADLETRIGKIATLEDTVALSDEYLHVLSHMVTVCLMKKGQRPGRGAESNFEVMERQIPKLVDQVRSSILNQSQDADDDDEVDVTALGGLG